MNSQEPPAESLSENFRKELDAASKESVLNPGYKRRKIVLWSIRTAITAALYIVFWEHTWVRWTLLVTVPLNLFSLLSIFGWSYFLRRKIERTKSKLEEADKVIAETGTE